MCAAEECEEEVGAVEMIAAEESWDVGMKVQGRKGKQIA